MKKKGFTLIELLVVIAIIAMLLAILMPALGRVKKMAQRLVCGTNLKGLGNALNVYAFDYRDEFPIAGGKGDNSGKTTWADKTDLWADAGATDKANVTISASLYMLVREADVGAKSFVCKGGDELAFRNTTTEDMVDLWDFGDGSPNSGGAATADKQTPGSCQSYSYQIPYTVNVGGKDYTHPADGTSNPANAIMADRSPWFDKDLENTNGNAGPDSWIGSVETPDFGTSGSPEFDVSDWRVKKANSAAHDRDGQNVLFGDNHVTFEKRPDVAARYDNIYLPYSGNSAPWNEYKRRTGGAKYQKVNLCQARNQEDSSLVNDFWEKN